MGVLSFVSDNAHEVIAESWYHNLTNIPNANKTILYFRIRPRTQLERYWTLKIRTYRIIELLKHQVEKHSKIANSINTRKSDISKINLFKTWR